MARIPPVLDDALGFNLYRVALLFRAELMHALSDYGLTPEQWQIMQALWSTGEDLTQNDVAHLTVKNKHTVSRILARLERDDWIQKRPHPDDGRAFVVEPTPRAQTLREEVPARLMEHTYGEGGVLECLSEDEIDELMQMLKKLRRHLGDA